MHVTYNRADSFLMPMFSGIYGEKHAYTFSVMLIIMSLAVFSDANAKQHTAHVSASLLQLHYTFYEHIC